MKIAIVPFTIAAYDDVLSLWQQCEGIGLSAADSKEAIQTYLDRNPGMSFMATADGAVVGAVLCGHDGRRGYIHHLGVDHRHRRRGVGRQLVERCLDALRRAGIQKAHMFIFHDNRNGIAFWKAAGWTPRRDIGVYSKNIEAPGGVDAGSCCC
jgi:ribosomal protein S18 acetylase RimI-like enzyme